MLRSCWLSAESQPTFGLTIVRPKNALTRSRLDVRDLAENIQRHPEDVARLKEMYESASPRFTRWRNIIALGSTKRKSCIMCCVGRGQHDIDRLAGLPTSEYWVRTLPFALECVEGYGASKHENPKWLKGRQATSPRRARGLPGIRQRPAFRQPAAKRRRQSAIPRSKSGDESSHSKRFQKRLHVVHLIAGQSADPRDQAIALLVVHGVTNPWSVTAVSECGNSLPLFLLGWRRPAAKRRRQPAITPPKSGDESPHSKNQLVRGRL